jgi:hypothetical protein
MCMWYAGPAGEGEFIWVLVNEHGPDIELGAYARVFEEKVA